MRAATTAISRTEADGAAVTTDSVMTSRISIAGESTIARLWPIGAPTSSPGGVASSR